MLKQFAYLNYVNTETFEVEDLDRLIAEVGPTPGPGLERVGSLQLRLSGRSTSTWSSWTRAATRRPGGS